MVQTFEVMKRNVPSDVTSCSLITATTLKGKLPPPVLPCSWKQKMVCMWWISNFTLRLSEELFYLPPASRARGIKVSNISKHVADFITL